MDNSLVVEVIGARSGSGLLLADRLVLTAAHLLVPPGRVRADKRAAGAVAVRLAGSGAKYAARCVWARYEGPDRRLDAGLLEIISPAWRPSAATVVRLGQLAGSAEVRVHAFGFPDAAVRACMAELSPVTGVVHTDSGTQSGRPEIVVDGEPERGPGGASLWAGLSGGPVFAAPGGMTSDVLLGIVISDPAEFASRRLRMIPAPAILADSAAAAIAERHCGGLAVTLFPEPGSPAQPPAPSGIRFSLPPDTAAFTGREEELERITAVVSDAGGAGSAVAVGAIDGMPGVGKTALAVRVAHLLSASFPDRQLFIDLHAHTPGRQPVEPEDALAGLLAAVGVNHRFLPRDLDGRAAMWRDQTAGQQMLLVLDNAASSSQVVPLLPGGGNCLVLVTSRRHLGDLPGAVMPVLLDVLSAERAEAMFTRLAPRAAADGNEVAEVVRLAGFLPLAVSLLARVFARHRSWTLADLAAETRDSLLILKAEHHSIAAAFEVSYRHLEPRLRRFFNLLGLHLGTTVDSYAAAALAGITLGEAAGLLDALHREGLVIETGYRRYGMHDLLRRYARDHAAEPDRERALDRLLDYYQHTASLAQDQLARQTRPGPPPPTFAPTAAPPLRDAGQALTWARADLDSLLACLDHATRSGQHSRVIALTAALAELLRRDGPWSDAVTRHATAVQSARFLNDQFGQANALNDLGDLRRLTGGYQAAADNFEQALAMYRNLNDQAGQANALTNLGIVRQRTGGYQAAADNFEQALAMYRNLNDQAGQANALTNLGDVRRQMGDFQAAAEDLKRAVTVYRDLADRLGQANALIRLGDVRSLTGNYPAAASGLKQALALYRDLADRLGQANALLYLGDVRQKTGDYQAAARELEQALAIHRDLGSRLGEANAFNRLGIVQRLTGDYPCAVRYHEQALATYRDLGNRTGQANALLYLGTARRETDDCEGAAGDLEQALVIYRELGNVGGEVEALNETGTLHRISGERVEAKARHQQALVLARAIGSARDEAYALAGLSRCAAAVGQITHAEALLRQAHVIFRGIGAADAPSIQAELDALIAQDPRGKR